jgi:selenocysteine lyase/cysteine desulfurase
MLAIHALDASLSLLLEAGMAQVEARLLEKTEYLMEKLSARPSVTMITPRQAGRYGGIVTFEVAGCSLAALFAELKQRNVVCAMRGGGIRFSPHFYTPDAVLDRALEHLDAAVAAIR